jgi:glycosyltransferase involved in cell wall biosynthesis
VLVSVIIPCYNVEDYIEECLNSVIFQTYKPIEIICINNNSTDSTLQKLQEFKNKYPDLILDNEFKPGANASRNKGLKISKGEWIQFLDADDLLEPTKIEHQINLLIGKSDCVSFIAAACTKRYVNGNEKLLSDLEENVLIASFINKSGNTCSNLWNKKVLIDVGMWDENIKSSQEVDLMLRIAIKYNDFIIDKKPLTVIRERPSGQISHRNPADKWKQFINIRLNYLEKLQHQNKNTYNEFAGLYFDFLMVSIIELAKYDKQEALIIYRNSVKGNWKSSGNYGFNRIKVGLIKYFGLKFFLNLMTRR